MKYSPSAGLLGVLLTAGSLVSGTLGTQCCRAEDAAPKTFTIGGAFQLNSPETWVSREPRTRIVEHEFAVPKAEGDDQDGRVTVMGAGGGVAANIDRWYQQFSQPDGSNTKERAKVEKKEIGGQSVTIVDLSGTYTDRPAPMAPGVERPNYRMLGAIIETKQNGNHFIKFYGPERTVTANAEAFRKMLDSIRQK
ncbi:MAG TPA: hypothetical protein VGN12_12430 [Pirellulales bacterium]|jgi:hypothetical protein